MPPRPSIARELFEQIKAAADPVAYIKTMINSTPPTLETDYLDFKGYNDDRGNPLPDKKVKEIWSEALAGFATAAGGVLIWGVDARKDPDTGIDAASGLNLVPNPSALQSRLQELHHQATDPPIPGIDFHPAPDLDSGGQGFLVCLVPESDYKPHRSEAPGGKRWVIRIGASFVEVPPALLRSLFSPSRRSYVLIRVARSDKIFLPNGGTRARYAVELHNEGPSTAGDLLVYVQCPGPMTVTSAILVQRIPNTFDWRINWGEPLHPGDSIQIAQIIVESGGNVADLTVAFQVHATDQVPYRYSVTIPASSEAVHETLP